MDVLVGGFFFGIMLPLIAIAVAVLAFSLVRRRTSPRQSDPRSDARIAALEEQVRSLLYRVWTLEQHAVRNLSAAEIPPLGTPDVPTERRGPQKPASLSAEPADAASIIAPAEPTAVEPIASAEPVAAPSPDSPPSHSAPPAAIDLEQRIGARWTIWIGAVAILFGIAFFLKWSFENNFLGPVPRVGLGLAAGVGLLASGLLLHRRPAVTHFSEGLTGLGLGVLYLALFGAHAVYGLIGPRAALGAMAVVTVMGALAAVVTNRQVTAVLAVLGGLLTPWLLTVTEPDERNLLAYLLILDLLVLAIARFRMWPGLNRLAWGGTALLFAAELSREPESAHPLSRLVLLSALFAVFLAVPLLQPPPAARRTGGIDLLLVVANAAGYFWAVYQTLEAWQPSAEAPYAMALAVVYWVVAADCATRRADDPVPVALHQGVAWTFLTLAVPLALSEQWVTLAWATEGVALLAVARRASTPIATWGGTLALLLAAARVAVVERHAPGDVPVWNRIYLGQLLVVLALAVGGLLATRAERVRKSTRAVTGNLLWLTAALLLALLLWREPDGLWPALLLTAELVAIAWLARATDAPAWAMAAPIIGAALLARAFDIDDLDARIASDSLLNAPLGTRVGAGLALLLAGSWVGRSAAGGRTRSAGRALSAAGGIALLYALSVGWTRYQGGLGWTTQVGLSVLWALYAAVVLGWGFLRSRPAARYAALGLLGLTAFKVFYVDLAAVRTAYRIVSFLVLGVVLLGVSLLYQKGRRATGDAPSAAPLQQ
jgi:uncharacterized membrane protein